MSKDGKPAKMEQVSPVKRLPAVRGCRVCRMHGARGGAPTGKRNGNYRHRYAHKGGDPTSEISQLVVTLGTEILRKACWPSPLSVWPATR